MSARMRCLMTAAAGLCLGAVGAAGEDYWEPRGAPGTDAGKMKTLEQVEPRVNIAALPFEITNSGSYYVTAPLQGVPLAPGITIRASHVRLDLCGFPLRGGTNTGDGIWVPQPCDNITIRNGVLFQWGGFGANATNARDAVLADLKAFDNGLGGLYVGDNAYVERCSTYLNGTNAPPTNPPADDGIRTGSFSTITGCKSRNNGGVGIHAYYHSRVSECTATESVKAEGIHVEDYCTVRDSTAAQNAGHGIRVANRCRVVGNTCGENGIMAPGTNAVGILADGDNSIIDGNNVMGNDIGIQVNAGRTGNLIIRNLSGKNLPGFDWPPPPPGNFVGPIELFGGGFTNTNPWANFKM